MEHRLRLRRQGAGLRIQKRRGSTQIKELAKRPKVIGSELAHVPYPHTDVGNTVERSQQNGLNFGTDADGLQRDHLVRAQP